MQRRRDRFTAGFGERLAGAGELRERVRGRVEQFRAREHEFLQFAAHDLALLAARDQDLPGGQRRRDRARAGFGRRVAGAGKLGKRVRGGVEQFRARHRGLALAARDQDLPGGQRRRDGAGARFGRRVWRPSAS